jgi:ABC-type xylose transport system permease subunit
VRALSSNKAANDASNKQPNEAPDKRQAGPSRGMAFLRACLRIRELNVLSVLLLVGFLISLFSPYFLTTNNLMGVFRSFSLVALMSIGMMLVIITGGIDLSGDSAKHDDIVRRAIIELADHVDVIVLAQVSMARLVPALGSLCVPVLSSPQSGVAAVRRALSR